MELAAKLLVRDMRQILPAGITSDARGPTGVPFMKLIAHSIMACGLAFAAAQAQAEAPQAGSSEQGWKNSALESFFTEGSDGIALREQDQIQQAWEALDEEEREMLHVDCVAALDVGAQVPSEGSATGDVAELPEVRSVEEETRNEMESEEAIEDTADADDPLTTQGPQRRPLLAEGIPAEAWIELCEAVIEQE